MTWRKGDESRVFLFFFSFFFFSPGHLGAAWMVNPYFPRGNRGGDQVRNAKSKISALVSPSFFFSYCGNVLVVIKIWYTEQCVPYLTYSDISDKKKGVWNQGRLATPPLERRKPWPSKKHIKSDTKWTVSDSRAKKSNKKAKNRGA